MPPQTESPRHPIRTEGSSPQGETFDIFISYRVRPDEPLAAAVKTLLESSLSPNPKVFVSGIGGLQSSNLGFREQIQNATMTSRAFVGIITPNSKEREWIFFEAGAAFGRNILYVPLLFDISPGALPFSISSYQATDVKQKDKMILFLNDIAAAIGATTRRNTKKNYEKFTQAIDPEKSNKDIYEITDSNRTSTLKIAYHELAFGRKDKGIELFDQIMRSASNIEEKARCRCARAYAISKQAEKSLRQILLEEEEEIRRTATFAFWLAQEESNPIEAIKLYEHALSGNLILDMERSAKMNIAQQEFLLGRKDNAEMRLIAALRSQDRHLKTLAAKTLCSHIPSNDFVTHLLLHVLMLQTGGELITKSTEFLNQHRLVPLLLYFAHALTDNQTEGVIYHTRGVARHQANLISLAFRDYRRSAALGVSVAKSNMAMLLGSIAVPEAGLEILREHEGTFDSDDPSAPYKIRGILEEKVHTEDQAEKIIFRDGKECAAAILRIANDVTALDPSTISIEGQWQGDNERLKKFSILIENGECLLKFNNEESEIRLVKSKLFFSWHSSNEELNPLMIIVAAGENGEISALLMPRKEQLGPIQWLDVRHSS
ncbi:MAG: toll/interleukin-1 receptor domain-containing protein [Myxococcota bacterium]